MKRFLLRISIFLTCNGLLFLVFIFFTSWMAKRNNNFKMDAKIKQVIFGHSHVEFGYNDSLIENFKNLGESGESYFYTLPKIKEIVRANPQLERVFLEFTNNHLSNSIERWILEKKYLGYYYAIYFPYVKRDDHLYIVKNEPLNYFRNLPIVCKDLLKKSRTSCNFTIEFGGYKSVQGTLSEYNKKRGNHENENFIEIQNGVSELQMYYLKEIITFLDESNIELILVRTPLHKTYQGYVNETDFNSILKTELANVKFLDLSKFPLSDDEFRDPEHVNVNGAKKLSFWFNNFLKKEIKVVFKKEKHLDYQSIALINSSNK